MPPFRGTPTQTTDGQWPERPSLRFLVHWSLRREQLFEPGLCPDAPYDGGRCAHCPLDKLDAAQHSEAAY